MFYIAGMHINPIFRGPMDPGNQSILLGDSILLRESINAKPLLPKKRGETQMCLSQNGPLFSDSLAKQPRQRCRHLESFRSFRRGSLIIDVFLHLYQLNIRNKTYSPSSRRNPQPFTLPVSFFFPHVLSPFVRVPFFPFQCAFSACFLCRGFPFSRSL